MKETQIEHLGKKTWSIYSPKNPAEAGLRRSSVGRVLA